MNFNRRNISLKLSKVIAVLIVFGLMIPFCSNAQEAPVIKLRAILTPPYIIGPGDELTITDRTLKDLFGQVETYKLTVAADGFISVPLPDGSQKNILVAGLTVDETANEVRTLFGQTLINPLVFVQISKYRPINVYIGGAVVKPGVYKIEKTSNNEEGGMSDSGLNNFGLSLTEAIQIAGGLKPRADITMLSLTRGSNNEKRILDLKELIIGEKILEDINIQPGDAIFVPDTNDPLLQAQSHVRLLGKLAYQEIPVSIVGEGKSTGNFILDNDATILDAIGKAGGLNEVGSLKLVNVSRYDREGVYRTYMLNVHDLINMGAKYDELAIRPGDSIELVASKGKEVRHFFNEHADVFINNTLGAFTQNLARFVVEDKLVGRTRRSETISTIKNGGGGTDVINVIGGNREKK